MRALGTGACGRGRHRPHLNQLGYSVRWVFGRDAIAASYQRRHGTTGEPDAVVITTSSSGGFLLAFLACFDAGDRVTIDPGYPRYQISCQRWDVSRGGP